MLFNSIQFLAFAPVVVSIHWALKGRRRSWFLLLASYVFYAAWDARFLVLIIASTIIDFTVAQLAMWHPKGSGRRRLLLWISVSANLGILGFFKYANFFMDGASDLLGVFGLDPGDRVLQIALPVGISFYTFQTMSYTIDVVRGRQDPETDLLTFATFVAYFPQLVAGPIERAGSLLPQLKADRVLTSSMLSSGLNLIALGYFRKVAIGDVLAPIVEQEYGDPSNASGIGLLVATYAFAFQIYADFAGYTDIARGVSRILGIELVRNFEQPYRSRSITEFWRRWHISLSNWLRDYLYISLGGNRRGQRKTYRNLFLTMALGGLWHGAGWNFVIWGCLNGGFLAVERLRNVQVPSHDGGGTAAWLRRFRTFHFVCLTWVFFRASSFADAMDVLIGIGTLRPGSVELDSLGLVAVAAVAVLVTDHYQSQLGTQGFTIAMGPVKAAATTAVMIAATLAATGTPPQDFIYFQF